MKCFSICFRYVSVYKNVNYYHSYAQYVAFNGNSSSAENIKLIPV